MFLKICANTNLEDARLAAALGADAVGFVLAPSPRQVTLAQVAAIAAELRPEYPRLERIGVFARPASATELITAIQTAHLTGAQLHFAFTPGIVTALRQHFGPRLRLIQTLHWHTELPSPAAFAAQLRQLAAVPEIDAVLVDSRTAAAEGGTGIAFDWNAASSALTALGTKPLLVAGGLTPANVGQAVRILQPWGVDVASGVERAPGVKDPVKLRAFLEAARS